MNALDFEYDGLCLSDFGCIICTFDSSSLETRSIGSQITFTKTKKEHGKKHMVAGSSYEDCIEAEFHICKNPDEIGDEEDKYFSLDDQRELTRWLNRNNFCKFRPLGCGYENMFFVGSFNLEKIELAGKVVGMTLHFSSDRPFALLNTVVYKFEITKANQTKIIRDISDEIGYIYPKLEVTCNADGDLRITNSADNTTTEILGCKTGETITFENLIIESDDIEHESVIMDDFNFNYPTISNTYKNRFNNLTFSIPCSVVLQYNPIRKVGV